MARFSANGPASLVVQRRLLLLFKVVRFLILAVVYQISDSCQDRSGRIIQSMSGLGKCHCRSAVPGLFRKFWLLYQIPQRSYHGTQRLIRCFRSCKYRRYIRVQYNRNRFFVEATRETIGLRFTIIKTVVFAQFIRFLCYFIISLFHNPHALPGLPFGR